MIEINFVQSDSVALHEAMAFPIRLSPRLAAAVLGYQCHGLAISA